MYKAPYTLCISSNTLVAYQPKDRNPDILIKQTLDNTIVGHKV